MSWTDKVVPETEITRQFACYVLKDVFGDVELTFEHELLETGPGIEVMRRRFSSPMGPVVVHTRKVRKNTEIVVEVSSKSWMGRYLRDSKLGAVVLSDPAMLKKLPF